MNVHRAIGGAIIADYGTLTLEAAISLAAFYAREARLCREGGAAAAARSCAERDLGLRQAIAAAIRWRRAAGWRQPQAADAATGFRPARTPEARRRYGPP